MTRIKRGSVARQRHKKILRITSGFKGSHSRLFRTANQQALKALRYAYFDRKKKKRNIKSLWIKRLNGTIKSLNSSYNKTMKNLKDKNIIINKKILSEISNKDKSVIEKLISS